MITRRNLIQRSLLATAAMSSRELFAEELATPSMTEGPFYPDRLPLDTDNDLLVINDALTPAVGEVTHLSGRILSKSGTPLRNAFVEIWQVDNEGVYLHSNDTRKREERDQNFQGYGRFLTDSQGRYYFRTIKPVPYTGRTPHIHFGISLRGERVLTTQMFVNGHPMNSRDGLFRAIRDPIARETLLVDFLPLPGSKHREQSAKFDIVLGQTAAELDDGAIQGHGKPLRS